MGVTAAPMQAQAFDSSGWFMDDGAAFHRFMVMRDKPRKRPVTASDVVKQARFLARDHGFRPGMFALGDAALARQEGEELLYQRLNDGATAYGRKHDIQALNALARFYGYPKEKVSWDYEKAPPTVHKVLASERLDRLLAYRHDNDEINLRRRAIIHLECYLGARISEVHNIQERDLDLSDPSDPRLLIRKPAKRGKRREIPLTPSLLSPKRPFGAWLEGRPRVEGNEGCLWTTTARGAGRGNLYGGPARAIDQPYFAKEIRMIGLDLGFQLNCTIMRHTVATRLLRDHGFDITYVQYWLGHSEIKSTMVYAEVGYGDIRAALSRAKGVDLFHRKQYNKKDEVET